MHKAPSRARLAGILLLSVTAAPTMAVDFDFYASLRLQAESVRPDKRISLDRYSGLRDAYSRIGINANHVFAEAFDIYASLELPLDLANTSVQDPWDQNEDIRIAKFGVRGAIGDISVGQMWLPYYNAIAYPVDMFSSYYSGFATYTSFRRDKTLSYYSPKFGDLSVAGAYSLDNGAIKSNGRADDRWQLSASYAPADLTLSMGIDQLGGASDLSLLGISAAWQLSDAWYIGAKYERHNSASDVGYGADGDTASNLYASYTVGRTSFKAMLADVDAYGERIIHLGIDHQYNRDLKFFAEYYSEQDSAAITVRRGGAAETCFSCDGGYALVVGLRYDISSVR